MRKKELINQRLEERLQEKVLEVEEKLDADIKVSTYDLQSREKISVKGDQIGWAASIIKVPIMLAVAKELSKGELNIQSPLRVDHRFTLEDYDYTSRMPDGSQMGIFELLYHMIVESDNEATNILADRIGVQNSNRVFQDLGLNRTMLGHLLCPNVPRYTSEFNPDGSNITCTDDMVNSMRQIYDRKFTELSSEERFLSNILMSYTSPSFLKQGRFKKRDIKSKVGFISDFDDGDNVHEVGIIDDRLMLCIMMNKIGQGKKKRISRGESSSNLDLWFKDFLDSPVGQLQKKFYSTSNAYRDILQVIGDDFYGEY